MSEYEIAVIGGGPAGMITALASARAGRQVALVAPEPGGHDHRTTALMDHSIAFLNRLGLWQAIRPHAAPLRTMRIIDGTDRLIRAPTVSFRAAEIELDAFGYNIPNALLVEHLAAAITSEPNITHFAEPAKAVETGRNAFDVTLSSGERFTAALAVGADGRRSMVRESAGISVRSWTYKQAALVLNFQHALPHDDISTEFHTHGGPFTQVPLPDPNRSSLVWVQGAGEAEAMAKLDAPALARAVEARMQSLLGAVTVEEPVQRWPLSSQVANQFGRGRVVLVGEAAHAFPPIGAQGLNLSLRDIMRLARLLDGIDGSKISGRTGDRYDFLRKSDVWSRTASVDLLNRSLLADFIPAQIARAAGLHMLASLPPLRQFAMREGVQPLRGLKALFTD
ncbi:UbiH/UbiF family hydroxylase [Martelella endophytica]|uniref:2-octaprenyl-6-methoxyphenyl hydroxylase n=1 Tax=Martelella endophytica TaxID=1486262 RepID=A0A0D5LSH2_MAREN|nr:UbiH/UbiF family hydroxylase [Martelella endophytica]AJY46880.1 2-octaprenyl-6-methoxyphenyl hydroxylase [Martelella endophytica]